MKNMIGFAEIGSFVADSSNVCRIDVMPLGRYVHGKAGKLNITTTELEQLASDINERAERIPVDFDHSFAYGRGSLAAGWFKPGTAAIEGTVLRADVELTEDAAADVRAGKYRYISPEWHMGQKADPETGKPVGRWQMLAAALTNRPFFPKMQAVTLADQSLGEILNPTPFLLAAEEQEGLIEHLGDSVFQALFAAANGDDPEVRDQARDSLIAAAKERTDNKKETTMDLTAIAEAVGLTADAAEDDVLKAAVARITQAGELETKVAELEKQIPNDGAMKALIASAEKGEKAHTELQELKRNTFIAEAVRVGKLDPAEKEHIESLWALDPDGVQAMVEARSPRPIGKAIGSDKDKGTSVAGESPATVEIAGSEYDVDEASKSIHDKAVELLTADGKADSYTADEYVSAVARAARELGVTLA